MGPAPVEKSVTGNASAARTVRHLAMGWPSERRSVPAADVADMLQRVSLRCAAGGGPGREAWISCAFPSEQQPASLITRASDKRHLVSGLGLVGWSLAAAGSAQPQRTSGVGHHRRQLLGDGIAVKLLQPVVEQEYLVVRIEGEERANHIGLAPCASLEHPLAGVFERIEDVV